MQPLMEQKRAASGFIPYRRRGDSYEYFLQRRDMDARSSAGLLGMFGGGIEAGETPEEAMYREVDEELVYRPSAPEYWSRFEHTTGINHVFIEEVGPTFEAGVTVREGEYGKFFTAADVDAEKRVTPLTKLVISLFEEYLSK